MIRLGDRISNPPWPRRLVNFPIILIAITQQYIWALAIANDATALDATGPHILSLLVAREWVVASLIFASTLAGFGFHLRRKMHTLLALLPQQFLMFLAAGGSFRAIWEAQFADGVTRSHAFLLVDQCPVVLIAIFHTWAIILIMVHAGDE